MKIEQGNLITKIHFEMILKCSFLKGFIRTSWPVLSKVFMTWNSFIVISNPTTF